MNKTNYVERHWDSIKYILLKEKVNQFVRDLIVVFIESAKNGTRLANLHFLINLK